MNSVERLDYYIKNVKSEIHLRPTSETKRMVIKNGKVEFKEFSMRYKENFPLVLKEISFSVKAGENVVIVGRTGCGKTSILLCLIRILRGCVGKILIDDEDIAECDLYSLRDSISTIPADPLLFSGTIRSNLDPHNKCTDKKVEEMLERCKIYEMVQKNGGLGSIVEENGKNMSIGERRLISLCRGLLRDPKILLLDECTSIDYHMDEKIQKIVTSLKATTVFSISHRLNNIEFFDKVLVLNNGAVEEFDSPKKLVREKSSFIRKLIDMIPNRDELLGLFDDDKKTEVEEIEEEDFVRKVQTVFEVEEKKETVVKSETNDQEEESEGETETESEGETEDGGETEDEGEKDTKSSEHKRM